MLNVQRDLLYEMITISIFTSSGILYFDVRSGSVKYKGEMIETLFSLCFAVQGGMECQFSFLSMTHGPLVIFVYWYLNLNSV